MKKIFSILSLLTISASAIPTTIAASPYQKEEKLNTDINYSKINNLENLNREKRQNNNFPENESPILRVSDNVKDYFNDLCQIIEYLQRNNIIRAIRGQIGPGDPGNPLSCGIDGHTPRENYFINPNQVYSYFIIPIEIDNNGQSKIIKLVFRSSDFYLQGFINNGNYYYFNEENNLNNIHGYNSNNLNFNGSYTNLIPSGNPEITWPGIQDAFFQLSNMGTSHEPQENILRASLTRVILSTSESIRFREVQNLIINSVSTRTFSGIRVYWERDFVPIIKDWNKITKAAIDYLLTNNNLIGFDRIQNILVFTYIISSFFNSCNNNNRQMRDLNNNEYCYAMKWQKQDYPLKNKNITTIKILDEDDKDKNLQKGDIFLGTSNGFYLITVEGKIINLNLNTSIKDIILVKKNKTYVLSDSGEGELFWLNIKVDINRNYVLNYNVESINIIDTNLEEIKILSIKEITKNSDDNYLQKGDIYVWTEDGGYLIRRGHVFAKIDINKHYFINHSDNNITTVHFNREDNSYCHSTGKKIAAVSTATAIGASAGSVIPGLGTLIGAGFGALIGGIGSVFITEDVCNHR